MEAYQSQEEIKHLSDGISNLKLQNPTSSTMSTSARTYNPKGRVFNLIHNIGPRENSVNQIPEEAFRWNGAPNSSGALMNLVSNEEPCESSSHEPLSNNLQKLQNNEENF